MSKRPAKCYTVNDGTLVLTLTPDEDGWFCVTSPLDPGLVTQARTLDEAFEMAYDARDALIAARKKQAHEIDSKRAAS